MQAGKFELIQCWKDERIDQVINKEAASVDRATFLATHMPLQNINYLRTIRHIADRSENGLLEELKNCSAENSHAFVVVQGIPGTGKSHLIRWLKERYVAEASDDERVLFIERAQCSLSSTLEQIIRSNIFDEATMRDQLEKLQGARFALSKEALADTLLDQLRIAAEEEQQEGMPDWLRRQDRLKKYLLDYRVRQELAKPGGPIDRLVRFLRSGPAGGIYNSEVPQFQENDFDFTVNVRREIQGYADARAVADRISGADGMERRQELAGYLNRLIRFAIGHATALTSDDFKQVFYDLRRQLHTQRRNLVLFIEDITVLTGIDRGLLDVLVTQHKGEGEQELCRLIAVIGITDSYFTDQVPDNIKDRITHHLVLSEDNEAIALSKPDATAELVARYLNAMRLNEIDLETWLNLGSKPDALPNACFSCPVQKACHQAFGFYTLHAGDEQEQRFGLYPFNRQALSTLYQHLDPLKSRRTQRALLYNVLHYILQSHGPRLRRQEFPPAPRDLGGEFTNFTLAKPLQSEVIRSQGGGDTGRIMTLMMIWGNRTVDARDVAGGYSLVGDLPREVFLAFGIAPIAGERLLDAPREQTRPQPSNSSVMPVDRQITSKPAGKIPELYPGDAIQSPQGTVGQNDKIRKYNEDISGWLDGESLRYYDEYADLLVPFIRTYIDWNFYGISATQVDEVLKGRRHLIIEGQEGKVNASYFHTLKRSPELARVMLGLIELKESGLTLDPGVLSGYLSQFSLWMHQHTEELVQFVRQPNRGSQRILPLAQILVLDCLMLAYLGGALKASYTSTQELFRDLVRFCIQTKASTWDGRMAMAQDKHSPGWVSLMRRMKSGRVERLCNACLQLLNCAQGGSNEVRFLDVATGLHILYDFRERHWQLPALEMDGTTTLPLWEDATTTFGVLRDHLASVIQNEQELVQSRLNALYTFTGEHTYQDIFVAMDASLRTVKVSRRGFSFEQNGQLNAEKLRRVIEDLRLIADESLQERKLLRLAQAGKQLEEAKSYAEYFQNFVQEAERFRTQSAARLAQLKEQMREGLSQAHIREVYREIAESLASLNESGGVL